MRTPFPSPPAVRPVARRVSLRRTSRARLRRVAARLIGAVVGRPGAGPDQDRCPRMLHGHRCQLRTGHPDSHLVDDGAIRMRWQDRTLPTDDWVLDVFDS
ncbi:hypothetical protein DEJ33_06920 [Curtobacterium sp. MCPF17_047]|uniref:hypothetical protein n=1 Tax=unclassified Curtobacterium TaxID=257496 RepID=UPI000DA6EE13|nr:MULTISPECIES: hypothetical protein [unclassified Curtobacterium]PZF66990.1 hypothetical protein DEJ33_06920 [Curtobacterium sp. MCPF17_047]WIB11697.1 hypothetical protein DEJ36_12290 [Curtobacterium sp. MCPF17_052]